MDINKIKRHLEANPRNFISIANGSTRMRKEGATSNKYVFSKSDVESISGSLEAFLKALPSKGFGSGSILSFRERQGKVFKTMGEVSLTFKTEKEMENYGMGQAAHQSNDMSGASVSQPQFSNYAQGASGSTTLPIHEYVQLAMKAQAFDETKDKLRKAESDLERKTALLDEAEKKLYNWEDKKQLEIQRIQSEQKSFMESPAFEKTVEALGSALPMLLNKGGSAQQPALAAPSSNLSAIKAEFVEAVSSEAISDDDVEALKLTLMGMIQVDQFKEALMNLMNQTGVI